MKEAGRHLWDVRTPMRDGVELSSDVYFPPAGVNSGPYPTLLFRTPYGNQGAVPVQYAKYLSNAGFVVALQDVRGRHDSDGDFYPFNYEGPDGYDSVEWFAAQEWSTGKIGMLGGSYVGWVQWAAAREVPPHLTALVSTAAAGKWGEELPYHNGMIYLPLIGWLHTVSGRIWNTSDGINFQDVYRHVPLRTLDEAIGRPLPTMHDWLDHAYMDDYWKSVRLTAEDFAKIDLPVLHITGWYDGDHPGTLFFYDGMLEHSPAADKQHVLIGPWDHAGTRNPKRITGAVDFGADAIVDVLDAHVQWFNKWLCDDDNGADAAPRARYFATGDNVWRTGDVWPPATTDTPYFLGADGSLGSSAGEGSDSYEYDPDDPVVISADWNYYATLTLTAPAPLDRRFVERRDDVLVYTSDVLEESVAIAGNATVRLQASSDCPDTDWVVLLTDVAPDGSSMLLTEAVMRARYRESLEHEALMTPGETYEFVFKTGATTHTFLPGHCIRVDVTSSYFPTYARNLNTGGVIAEEAEPRVATNTIFHSSYIDLPVVNS